VLRILLHSRLKKQHSIWQVPLLKSLQAFFKRLRMITQRILLLKLVSLQRRETSGKLSKRELSVRAAGTEGQQQRERWRS
jgi:hypothetical protein